MAEFIEAVTSWPTLLTVLLVFGFAPGFVLRLIVLAYPKGDPRRRELIAELYIVPRIVRPLWVAEKLEVALFEGVPRRLIRLAKYVRLWMAIVKWAFGAFSNDYTKAHRGKKKFTAILASLQREYD